MLGLAGGGAKLVYSFLPMFNVIDIIAFFTLAWVGWRVARPPLLVGTVLLSLPALVLSMYFLSRLGWRSLAQGVGTGWAISALVVPAAAAAGFHASRRWHQPG